MAPSVYILLHRNSDASGNAAIVSVFAELQDANDACLAQAAEAKVVPKTQVPKEPLRWEAPDGTACWVEKHTVVPHKLLAPAAARPDEIKRNKSSLYLNDDDDVIEVQDQDGHYD